MTNGDVILLNQDTGLLVYFDVPEKNLRDLVILDPKWLVDVMSS